MEFGFFKNSIVHLFYYGLLNKLSCYLGIKVPADTLWYGTAKLHDV
jgi:hypothetical protein